MVYRMNPTMGGGRGGTTARTPQARATTSATERLPCGEGLTLATRLESESRRGTSLAMNPSEQVRKCKGGGVEDQGGGGGRTQAFVIATAMARWMKHWERNITVAMGVSLLDHK